MSFDVSKLKDDFRIPPPDSPLVGRIPDIGTRATVDTAIPRSVDLDAVARGRARDGVLASKSLAALENPLLRAFVEIPSRSTLEAARPSGAFELRISALGASPLLKTMSEFGSLAGAGSQASTAFNVATMRGVVDSFRNLDPLKESTKSWQSIHDVVSSKSAIKKAAGVERSFASQYGSNAFGFGQHFDVSSFGFGAGAAQGFLRTHEPPWTATLESIVNSPLFDTIRKVVVGLARRVRELFETWWSKLDGVSQWLRREMERWPRDPYGDLVPFWNVWLYRLAQAAYAGDYVARARFLDELEADDSPDNVLMIGELLKPTFDPERVDRRVDWEQMDPAEARRWLQRRLDGLKLSNWKEEQERKNGERRYELERQVVEAITFDTLEFELREDEKALYERLRGVLPEQQYWFCWYRAQGLKYEEIAAKMGIALGTVKAHAHLLRRNPSFLEVVGR